MPAAAPRALMMSRAPSVDSGPRWVRNRASRCRVAMCAPDAEIAVESTDGSRAEVDRAGLAALAGHMRDIVI